MNKQNPGIEWTHVYGRDGYTWNPVKGCLHDCTWTMPDGAVAECYAKTIAERLSTLAYPYGFAHLSFNAKEIDAPRRVSQPAGIFSDSMADLVGAQVPDEWIQAAIQTMRDCPQHIFFVLTKNPPRLPRFDWPENAWIGVSAPPSSMFGKPLSPEQQTRWYDKALGVLGEIDVPIRWTSIEPLSWDVSPLLEKHWRNFEWAVIGAATNGRVTHQPDEKVFRKAYYALGGKACFLKGNIDKALANRVCGRWIEQFPIVVSDWREQRAVV